MAKSWIDITDASGTRREALRDGLTRVGGGEAEVTVADVTSDQLHVWSDPLRAVFVGDGAPPFCEGAPFVERDFAPGEYLEWSGVRITFGGESSLEEIPAPSVVRVARKAVRTSADTSEAPRPEQARARAWNRVRAGLYIEQGAADADVVALWQKRVMEGDFDVDACADDILGSASEGDELQVLERSGRLMRDFLMASAMRGMHGASRGARKKARNGIAFLLAQVIALLVYSLIIGLSMLFMRINGTSFDGFFDGILGRSGG